MSEDKLREMLKVALKRLLIVMAENAKLRAENEAYRIFTGIGAQRQAD